VRGCMDALERAKPNRRIHVVCHDLTPHARQYLEDGRLDFIVDQDFSAQRVWILRTTGMDGLCPFMVLVRTCSD
jgi:ABC-type sugar transport system substrate-binding protein